MKLATLIYSGGLDSTVLLYQLRDADYDVHCLSFQYGQKHGKELAAATDICRELGVTHYLIHLPTTGVRTHPTVARQYTRIFGGSSQTDTDIQVPEGHYADENMKITIVPNRNMVMLSVAAAYARSHQIRNLFYAAHAGDHAIYPDCRGEFIYNMAKTLLSADFPTDAIQLFAPFSQLTKTEVVAIGEVLKVPFEKTWSCYKGEELHCGTCGTCVERREAFQLCGVPDPTEYARRIKE